AAVERRLEAELACGRHAEAIAELEQLVTEQPLREHVRALFMLALYRSGRQAEALAAYRSGRQALVAQLGIEPRPPRQEVGRGPPGPPAALDPRDVPRHAAPSVLVCTLEPGTAPAAIELAAPLAADAVIATTVARADEIERALALLTDARGRLAG